MIDFVELDDDIKPVEIKKHGTKIVLLGNTETENTMRAPEGSLGPSRWIAKYLNMRYFRFPQGVTVKAREGWESPRSDQARNKLRTVTGQEKYLNDHAESQGKVELSGAIAHWWILKDSDALTQDSNYYASAGHIASLYQDELYEMATSRAGSAKLQQFGVIFGYRQVVIYVEPREAPTSKLTTDTARTRLLLNNEPLPWSDWAADFRENMPMEIENLVKEKAAGSSGKDHSRSIRERLRNILDLYKVSRYRPTPNGNLTIDETQLSRGGQASNGRGGTGGGNGSGGSKRGGTSGNVYSLFEKKDGAPGQKVRPDPFPKVDWVSAAEGTREPNDDLEDRAAKFIIDQNRLLINADFRVFADMISRWHKEVGGGGAAKEIIVEVVRAWFEQALVETVIGVQALQNAKEWPMQNIQTALSQEALTATVMQRYHIDNSIKREIGSKLGKMQTARTADG